MLDDDAMLFPVCSQSHTSTPCPRIARHNGLNHDTSRSESGLVDIVLRYCRSCYPRCQAASETTFLEQALKVVLEQRTAIAHLLQLRLGVDSAPFILSLLGILVIDP